MAVIKSANAPAAAAAFSMRDIETHARGLIARAQQQAEQLLAVAQAEAETLRTQAAVEGHAEGFARGEAEGLAAGHAAGEQAGHDQAFVAQQADLSAQLSTLTALITDIDADRAELQQRAIADVLDLALALARRVTKRQATLDPQVAIANVTAAVKLVVSKADLRLSINPAQRSIIETLVPRLKQTWPTLGHVAVVDDETVSPGGCRVASAGGEIDADIDQQLDRIAADLLPDQTS